VSARIVRCKACRAADLRYCEHRRVLCVYVDGQSLHIIGENEERARLAADRVRTQWKGKPFSRRQETERACVTP
jgi:hypothetical protein